MIEHSGSQEKCYHEVKQLKLNCTGSGDQWKRGTNKREQKQHETESKPMVARKPNGMCKHMGNGCHEASM